MGCVPGSGVVIAAMENTRPMFAPFRVKAGEAMGSVPYFKHFSII